MYGLNQSCCTMENFQTKTKIVSSVDNRQTVYTLCLEFSIKDVVALSEEFLA